MRRDATNASASAQAPAFDHLLVAGATLSTVAALAHLGCLVFGGAWYRVLGAGERMARMADAGHWYPPVVTIFLSLVLLVWALYALSGAGVVRRLPWLRTVLCGITAIYVLRGVAFVPLMPLFPGNPPVFWFVSSGICLAFGLVHLGGLRQAWVRL